MCFVFLHLASGRKQQDDRKVTTSCTLKCTSFVYLLYQRQTELCGFKAVAPEFVYGVFPQLVEFDLLRKDVQRYVDRPSQPPATLVIVQDGVEAGTVPVEEVFVPEWVKVPDPSGRVTQQRVRELVQRPKLSLEPQPAHLKHQILDLHRQFADIETSDAFMHINGVT
jgi:hypothetical protein